MTTKEIKKLEKIARESEKHARKAIAKSNELQIYLSLLEAKAGKVKEFKSVDEAFKRLGI